MGGPVKASRDYDSSRRRDAASARRAGVLEAARTLFLGAGFARVTVAAIADRAGVSQETVYKAFGGKTGLVEALYRQGLEGEGPVPAYQRSDALRGSADASSVLYGWSRLSMEVGPRVYPIWLMVRDAAVVDPALRVLLREMDDDRYRRMAENARFLADAGHLGVGVEVEAAADLMWSVTAPEMYELLVLRRGWSVERWADSIYATISVLLRPR